MGNCFVTKIDPPQCKHELLNEYNDQYFDRVQARNSTQRTKKPWTCAAWQRVAEQQKQQEEENQEWPLPVPQLTAVSTLSTTTSHVPPSFRSSPTSTIPEEDEEEANQSFESSPWKPPHLLTVHSFPSATTPNGSPFSSNSYSPNSSSYQAPPRRIQSDAATDGWQVKRKGHALRLRLAKNRLVQMASTQSDPLSPALSPITLDPEFPSSSNRKNDEWDAEFQTNGMVWVEISRKAPVTALAMSRTRDKTPSIVPSLSTLDVSRPLLMAVGDEDGMVTVTEIVDEHRSPSIPSENSSSLRKFGETLEFPLQGRIRSVDFSPDDRYLIVGGDGCLATILLIVLDPATSELCDLRVLHQVERVDRIYSVQFHPIGAQLSIAGYDGKVAIGSVEDVLSSKPDRKTFKEISRAGLIYSLDWSPTGTHFAVGGSDKVCAIYSDTGKLVHEKLRKKTIQALKWNHDGKYLAVGDREVAILDGHDFHVKCEICNTPDSSPVNAAASKYRIEALCWSPDGSFLAIGGSDGICLVLETKGYALVHEVHRPSRIICLSWGQRISNNEFGRYLAISDQDCSVALIKAGVESDGSEMDEASSTASSSYFSTSSDWILREDSFRDMDDALATATPHDIKPQGNITAVAFSRSSKSKVSSYLAYAADDCSLTIMTTKEWKAVFQMEFAKPLRALVFSHSNNFLALGGDEGVLYVLSVPSRSIIFNTIFNAAITTVAFSRHDERLAIGTKDGVLTLLCPDVDWEPMGELDFSESPILAQDWGSKTLAIGREDGSVSIFDSDKAFDNFFVPLAEFADSKPVRSLSFGSSGRFLAVGGDNGILSILSSTSGWRRCNEFRAGGYCSILAIKWSPAGRYLAFAGSNKTCRVIDTITWADVSDVHVATSPIFQDSATANTVSALAWSIDGKWLALGSAGSGIHVLGTVGWQLLAPSQDRLKLSPSVTSKSSAKVSAI